MAQSNQLVGVATRSMVCRGCVGRMEGEKIILVVLVATAILGARGGRQENHSSLSTNATTRATLTLNGIFNYFWKGDPIHKNIKFLFSCGQLGYTGTSKAGQCSCYSTDTCINCYRWWTAVMMESVASYGILMNTTNHTQLPSTVFAHSPYNAKWDAADSCTYVDDFLWYGIAYLRIYDWLQDKKWLNHSIDLYDWGWKYGWDGDCGGFLWSTCPGGQYKFNIELLEALHLGAKLAYTLPDERRFLNESERIWQWFFSYDNGHGLMSEKFIVSTGAIPLTCCNATSKHNPCKNSKSPDAIYSQGLLLSASAYLYLATGNATYLKTGLRAVEAVIQNYTTPAGVLIDEMRGFPSYASTCTSYSDPGGDWFSFSGIFMLHLGYFTELLVGNGSMPDSTLKAINLFIQKTSDSAWNNSAVWPPFNQTNVCKPGSSPVNKKAREPKFHWWWGEDKKFSATLPSDPGYYFHTSMLRCNTINGNDTQIWEGEVDSEDTCRARCDKNVNCSKYLWQLYEEDVVGYNCWIWSYNRSNHICETWNSNWNVGVKRPKGIATCAGKCRSTEPQKLDHGVCYCDAICSKHLDCCTDYADHCTASKPLSCKGYCNKPLGQAIPGGGYCWCMDGCNPGYTGGSCCPDYLEQCNSDSIQPCFDGRSQGSALNLFLGHSMVSKAVNTTHY